MNYKGVYLTKPGKYPNLPPVDVNVEYELRSKIDFENYLNEQRTATMYQVLITYCNTNYSKTTSVGNYCTH